MGLNDRLRPITTLDELSKVTPNTEMIISESYKDPGSNKTYLGLFDNFDGKDPWNSYVILRKSISVPLLLVPVIPRYPLFNESELMEFIRTMRDGLKNTQYFADKPTRYRITNFPQDDRWKINIITKSSS